MHPLFPLSPGKALCRLVLCLGLVFFAGGLSLSPAVAQTYSGQGSAAEKDSPEAGRGQADPDLENSGGGASLWEQFFGGSYVGAVLSGYPAQGPGLPDLLLGCAAAFILLRALRSRRQQPDRKKPRFSPEDLRGDYRLSKDAPRDEPPADHPEQSEDANRDSGSGGWSKYLESASERNTEDMRQKARSVWDALRSQPEAPARPEAEAPGGRPLPETGAKSPLPAAAAAPGLVLPAGFDLNDFLDGARMLYARLQTAWAARDLDDLLPFATPEMLDLLRRQAEQDPTPSTVEVIMVTAVLRAFARRGEQEQAEVAFSAILQENPTGRNQGEKISVEETWQFVRGPATGGGWRLAGIGQAQ
jgi:predicted lipid-binding transport protein (Tim44 family)